MPSPPSSKKVLINKNDISTKSPPRKSRLKFDFPIETLIALSQFRQDEAARILGVASITLKRNCQRKKYRWPYRTIKAQHRREARLTAQKQHVDKSSLPPSELLLSLKNASLFSSFPSSVNGLVTSVISKPKVRPQLPLTYETVASKLPPQLPPLRLLLQNLRVQSLHATLPRLSIV
ncbi:unnamed protein product [Peronospora destructor]|uniref:RWP-RK domain-containing protein n=1 Tax=Peronospora destructor TaxID=86335 RepID=A0AAV0V383_9STRA|nr:unnamed protein product [Peronospora destructor]